MDDEPRIDPETARQIVQREEEYQRYLERERDDNQPDISTVTEGEAA